jgi:hypothetical protein
MLPGDVMEAPVGRDNRILFLNRDSEVEAVVSRMTKVDRQTRSGGGELAHRMGNGDRRGFQHFDGLRKILPQRGVL